MHGPFFLCQLFAEHLFQLFAQPQECFGLLIGKKVQINALSPPSAHFGADEAAGIAAHERKRLQQQAVAAQDPPHAAVIEDA